MNTSPTYTLRNRGTQLRVETWIAPGEKKPNRARLMVEGTEVESGIADEVGHLDLGQEAGHPTRVTWWWTGRVAGCALVEPGHGDVRRRSVPYEPPAGTRAARVHAWGAAHPGLYASRHVVFQTVGAIVAILGIGAIVRAFISELLPRIDFSWLPDFHLPGWLKYLDPAYYLAPLFRWVSPLVDRLLGWIPDFELGWAKYVIGFLIAITVAVRETRRRKRISQVPAERQDAQ